MIHHSASDQNENENSSAEVMIGDSRLYAMSKTLQLSENDKLSKFDFATTFQHERDANEFSCTISASSDLFDITTVDKIGQRFHSMIHQLFSVVDVQMEKPIYALSLTLPDESSLMQSMNNTQFSFASTSCIHHEFIVQVMNHSQKLAVELDEQSLTYSELLHYVQVLSLNFISKQGITIGDVVCQCVERSLSMVSSSEKSFFRRIKILLFIR